MWNQILNLKVQFRFVRTFLIYVTKSVRSVQFNLASLIINLEAVLKEVGTELADACAYAKWFHHIILYRAVQSVPIRIDLLKPEFMAAYDCLSKCSKGSAIKEVAGHLNFSFHVKRLLEDKISALNQGLQFLGEFLKAPGESTEEVGNLKLTHVGAVVREAGSLYNSYVADRITEDMEWKTTLALFKLLNAEAMVLLDSSTRSKFLDKAETEKLYEGLIFLRAFLTDVPEDGRDVAYEAEYVIDSFRVKDYPIWCLIWLCDVIEEIKTINKQATWIYAKKIYYGGVYNVAKTWRQLKPEANTSTINKVMVTLNDQVEIIINLLTRESLQLDYVTTVGMPGLGKTTFAKKVYNDPSAEYHFNVCAWCCVYQVYKKR